MNVENYKIKNNIFYFATKELSQDAFICWLVNWKNFEKENKELNIVADKFLNLIFKKAKKDYNGNTKILEILPQEKNCDILIRLYNGYYIIIEDKIFTKEHMVAESKKKQLESYKTTIKNSTGINEKKIITVYYKMIDEIDTNKTADVIIEREDMINLLKKEIKNDIYMDYRNRLLEINNNIKNIEEENIKNWSSKPELFYAFEKNNKNIFKDLEINRSKSSLYIDWNFKEFKPKNNKMKIKRIYLFVDLNFNKLETGIVLKEVGCYDEEYFETIRQKAKKCLNAFGDSVEVCRKAGKSKNGNYMDTKRLCKVKMNKYFNGDMKLKDLKEIMKKMQNALNEALEN